MRQRRTFRSTWISTTGNNVFRTRPLARGRGFCYNTGMEQKEDYILRAVAADGTVRAFFADTRASVGEAAKVHGTSPVMTAALGRLLTAAAMMGQTLKNDDDLVTLIVKGDGPGGGLLATADSRGRVKGYPYSPLADLPLRSDGKLDVGGAMGRGTLTVVRDNGDRQPYSGTVELVTGEIAEDVAYYYAQSEQIPSAVSLGVLVDTDRSVRRAGGFMIQLMPGSDDRTAELLESRLSSLGSLTSLYEQGHTPESLAELALGDLGCETLGRSPVRFVCDCSRGRMESALLALGREELTELLSTDGGAELSCHFCNRKYRFSADELKALISRCCG